MLAIRLMLASTALPPPPDDSGSVFGGRLSFVGGGLYESYRLPSGRMGLQTINSSIGGPNHPLLSYSSGGTVGFGTIIAPAWTEHRLRKVDSDNNILFDSGVISLSSLFDSDVYASQCLEDRIATVRGSGSSYRVDSMGWNGPSENLGSALVPAWLSSKLRLGYAAVGTVDAQAATVISQGRYGQVSLIDGKIVRGGREIPYDYFTVASRDSEVPLLFAMFDTPTGAPREFLFEPFPECDVVIPAGANTVPVHVRTYVLDVKKAAFGMDGGAYFIASCTVTEMRWDGTVRGPGGGLLQPEITASLARNTTEFIAKVHPSGGLSLVRLLSRNSWWFELQDFMLGDDFAGGEHRIVFTEISGIPKFSTPRVISQASDNFNFVGKPPVTQTRDAIIENGPRSWAVLDDMTYIDNGRNFMLLREGAWNSGVFWKVGSDIPEKIETPIPAGAEADYRLGVFDDERVWLLFQAGRTSSSSLLFERSETTGWSFQPTDRLDGTPDSFPDGFYSV